MRIIVDIDNTICSQVPDGDYSKAEPMVERIEAINDLYDNDNYIIYWTARGSETGIDWTEVTRRQFAEWGVKHHELRLGKPHYDLMICDKTFNPNGVKNVSTTLSRRLRDAYKGRQV